MKKQVTIYSSGSFGISKIEGVITDFGFKDYAQYKNAPFINFIRKGKRKEEQMLKTYNPYLLVIDGYGHPDPGSCFEKPEICGDLIISKTTYSCFDDRYKTDFDQLINDYIKDKNVIIDIRHTVGTNSQTIII